MNQETKLKQEIDVLIGLICALERAKVIEACCSKPSPRALAAIQKKRDELKAQGRAAVFALMLLPHRPATIIMECSIKSMN